MMNSYAWQLSQRRMLYQANEDMALAYSTYIRNRSCGFYILFLNGPS